MLDDLEKLSTDELLKLLDRAKEKAATYFGCKDGSMECAFSSSGGFAIVKELDKRNVKSTLPIWD